jgi:hypothetical protein
MRTLVPITGPLALLLSSVAGYQFARAVLRAWSGKATGGRAPPLMGYRRATIAAG